MYAHVLSFARRYEAAGVPRSRVLIKLAATWEGIQACRVLELESITCNLTLIFGVVQVREYTSACLTIPAIHILHWDCSLSE